jgi:hypothetical protein
VPAPQDDRYEPLPGLLQLPSFLYRKLGPRGRIAVAVGGAVLLVAAVAAAIVLVPRIADTKRERADRERREAAAATAERRRRLIREQRPHHGRSEASASRAAVLAELQAAILADARARTASGQLAGPPAKSVRCRPLTGADAAASRVPYDCIAVTSELPSDESLPQGVIGHPFRAVAHFSTGRFTWCKVSGRAGEGGLTQNDPAVRLPRACSR